MHFLYIYSKQNKINQLALNWSAPAVSREKNSQQARMHLISPEAPERSLWYSSMYSMESVWGSKSAQELVSAATRSSPIYATGGPEEKTCQSVTMHTAKSKLHIGTQYRREFLT